MRSKNGLSILVLLFVCLLAPVGVGRAAPALTEEQERAMSDTLYREAQQQLEKKNYPGAIASLEKYLEFTKTHLHRPERVFWAIDELGYVHLGVRRDADAAIRFFRSIREDARLTDLDRAAIDEWIAVAGEWKQAAEADGSGVALADQLFQRGKRYFSSGLEKEKKLGVGFARADYSLASGHLQRFALLHDRDSRIGEVLYMLGKVRGAVRADPEHWSDNFYLKEVIRRFPHSELAQRAYVLLRRETTGAFGPNGIPAELAEQLEEYGALAGAVPAPE